MRITWDAPEDRFYSSGISHGVLYPGNAPGVAWNGLISVNESGEQNQDARYFDGQKYHNRSLTLALSGSISAYTYPDEFEPYAGIFGGITGQDRRSFGLSYRTTNEIHLVYNVMISQPKQDFSTIGEHVVPSFLEWNFTTKPVKIPGGKSSSHIVILIDESPSEAIFELEALIYGNDENDPYLPEIEVILEIFESNATIRITNNDDGTWTATGPDSMVILVDSGIFRINADSVVLLGNEMFRVSSSFTDEVPDSPPVIISVLVTETGRAITTEDGCPLSLEN